MRETVEATNPGRRIAYETFRATLAEHYGQSNVTESAFRDSWLTRLRSVDELTSNGWYEPPPLGMAVLFADEDDVSRISYESLRLPEFAPGSRVMSWRRGMMYAYCSPVHRPTGLAGDFGVTLYFGGKVAIRDHFRRAFTATDRLLSDLSEGTRSAALLHHSEDVFSEHGLKNTIASVTDSVPLDLGHSIPTMEIENLRATRLLSRSDQQRLREQRRFVSTSADWTLAEERQVTIEPQLVALGRPDLPQVSFHYVVATSSAPVTVLRECDALLREFQLAD
jgi:hypothetical protein